MADSAQSLGIVCQREGEDVRRRGDEPKAREYFTEAARLVGESLAIRGEDQNEPGMADSHGQLAAIHLFLGNLDRAEAHVHEARVIHERLDLKEAWKDYDLVASIARARKNPTEAAAWEQKRDSLLAELERRAGGPWVDLQALANVAVACTEAGLNGTSLEAPVEEALTQAAKAPSPLDTIAPFLRALAAGTLPDVPPSLPRDIAAVLAQVLDAVRKARR